MRLDPTAILAGLMYKPVTEETADASAGPAGSRCCLLRLGEATARDGGLSWELDQGDYLPEDVDLFRGDGRGVATKAAGIARQDGKTILTIRDRALLPAAGMVLTLDAIERDGESRVRILIGGDKEVDVDSARLDMGDGRTKRRLGPVLDPSADSGGADDGRFLAYLVGALRVHGPAEARQLHVESSSAALLFASPDGDWRRICELPNRPQWPCSVRYRIVPEELRPGWNRLLVRLCSGRGEQRAVEARGSVHVSWVPKPAPTEPFTAVAEGEERHDESGPLQLSFWVANPLIEALTVTGMGASRVRVAAAPLTPSSLTLKGRDRGAARIGPEAFGMVRIRVKGPAAGVPWTSLSATVRASAGGWVRELVYQVPCRGVSPRKLGQSSGEVEMST